MRIVACRKVEDCFDGSSVFSYELSEEWTEASVRMLAPLGQLELFSDFPRPLFRLRSESGFFVKGVVGSNECRAIFPRENRQQVKDQFEQALRQPTVGEAEGTQPQEGRPTWE